MNTLMKETANPIMAITGAGTHHCATFSNAAGHPNQDGADVNNAASLSLGMLCSTDAPADSTAPTVMVWHGARGASMYNKIKTTTLAVISVAATLFGSGHAWALDAPIEDLTFSCPSQPSQPIVMQRPGATSYFVFKWNGGIRNAPNGGLYGNNVWAISISIPADAGSFTFCGAGPSGGITDYMAYSTPGSTAVAEEKYGFSFKRWGAQCHFYYEGATNTQVVAVPGCLSLRPVANAGPDLSVAPSTSVALDGTLSTNPSALGNTLTYAWIQTAGPTVTLTGSTSASPTFNAPLIAMGQLPVTLSFQLVVTNGIEMFSIADSVNVVVTPALNQAPTANAGPDQTVASATAPVTLNGTGSSDPNAGQTLTYAWTAPAGITLSNATAASPTFSAPTLAVGAANQTLTFSLIVTDNLGVSSVADTVTITVTAPANVAPTANAGPDQTVASATAPVTLNGTGSTDPNAGQTLTYAWTAPAGITLSNATAASPTFTAPTLAAGAANQTLTFSLIVTDNLGASSIADTVTITVVPPVPNPSVAAIPTLGETGMLLLLAALGFIGAWQGRRRQTS